MARHRALVAKVKVKMWSGRVGPQMGYLEIYRGRILVKIRSVPVQIGPVFGLPGGSRWFNRVPLDFLCIIYWSTVKNKLSGSISVHFGTDVLLCHALKTSENK